MLARAIAGEAEVPFFCKSGSDFDEMLVGVGARRVKDLFAAAKKCAPCIIFIDEIDAFGKSRNPKEQKHPETLYQFLVELDGFKQNDGVIVIAATNFPESLDKALIRPGRFDRNVVVPLPDVEGRRQIMESYMSKVLNGGDVDLNVIARGTPGFSGADLANMVNVAAIRAAKDGAKEVSMADLEYAKDKIMMGTERKSAVISEKSRKLTAFHEGGHALVAIHTDGARPVHKATIVPRGMTLGMVAQLPDKDDETSTTYKQMLAMLDVCMGGRVAEELIFGKSEVTSGASSDLQKATSLAREMITKYGMSEKVGLVTHNYDDDGKSMSTKTRLLIEKEVKDLLDRAYTNAKTILTSHSIELHALANALLLKETLTGAQINALLDQIDEKQMRSRPVLNDSKNKNGTPNKRIPVLNGGDVDLNVIARGTPGFSGADLANMVNVAAIRAAKDGAKEVSMADLEYAKDKIMMGTERKSAVISEKSRKLTAFHEGGHALVAIHTDGARPVHKATIVPRGMTLGMVAQLPDKDDETSTTYKQMLAMLDVCMGGRVAEELIFGKSEVTSAREMITKYGMSEKVGLVTHNYDDDGKSMSTKTRLLIEKEVKDLLDRAYTNAKTILTSHSIELHALANALLLKETLTGAQINALLDQIDEKQMRSRPVLNDSKNKNGTPNKRIPVRVPKPSFRVKRLGG
ncbi:hypothetical protein MKW92_004698 [Papaver armeniacum]|nr:hypothetical protein MKW92_004698 [Papaver armeniacum]